MAGVQAGRVQQGYLTARKGNRVAKASYWAQGKRLWLAIGAALLTVAFALSFVWTNHQIVNMGYAISGLHQERVHQMDLNRKFKLELANLTALDRLEHLAKNQLGLASPRPEQVQVIE